MTEAVKLQVACKAIIVRDGKILLLRESAEHDTNNKAGLYQFPGGRIEADEVFDDGLKREVMEETGLEVSRGEPFFVGEWFPVVKGTPLHIVAIFFLCEAASGEVVISEEHDQYVWASKVDWKQLGIMVPDNQVVEKYFKAFAK